MLLPNILEFLAKFDNKYRYFITSLLPFPINSLFYSNARKIFIKQFTNAKIKQVNIPVEYNIKLWDIDFNCSIFNAAGMFKNAEGYYTCAKMGAGAFLAGTTTYHPRLGNTKLFIKHPFIPYHNSNASSNWMGLPNSGHTNVAKIISSIQKKKLCPIGASLSENPETIDNIQKVKEIVEGIKMYDRAGVDFIELNFSCPNVIHNSNTQCNIDDITVRKLSYISENYIKKRNRNIPIIAKYSNDISNDELIKIIDILIEMQFDGINIGNTSTRYNYYLSNIHTKDIKLYNKFTNTFGGGLSGKILKNNSLSLCKTATEYIKTKKLSNEFHCIRTGGISNIEDIIASQNAGIMLNQWFTGFFEYFARSGFKTYQNLFK